MINPNSVYNLYQYGSRVYGCTNYTSDYDYIAVSDFDREERGPCEDYTFYSVDSFKKLIEAHEINALECLFLPREMIVKEDIKFDFNLDLKKLRRSISTRASNSWVKCKKKLTVKEDYDPYIGKKSLFHCLRIVLFGTQIAKNGKIIDYTEANKYFDGTMNNPINEWDYYKNKYQPIYNNLMSEFRREAPK